MSGELAVSVVQIVTYSICLFWQQQQQQQQQQQK
jgi:hypothetical protein